MSNRFINQSRQAIIGMCTTMVLTGFYACTDSYDLDEKGNTPTQLGKSIYEELEQPSDGSALQGTFKTYLRLIDDLGYKEVMSKTGSKTVFVANDSAFSEFFKNNDWNVTSYEELTEPMKKQLFNASVLDNAILTEMLSNIESNNSSVSRGIAMKHQTSANATDTIYHLWTSEIPVNNSYWTPYLKGGIDLVMDNTRPMMVHFTQEQMLNNSITDEDFATITGKPYEAGATFIFKNKVITKDVTCQNGYINQTDGVITPPGNMAQILRKASDTKWFSRMLDRFCAPYYDASTTNNYNDYAVLNGKQVIDSIFQLRYFSERSQGAVALQRDPKQVALSSDMLLKFDPGWNQYYSTYGTILADMGSMFVPTDQAVEDYFLNSSNGGYNIINLYAQKPNTKENLGENLDSIPINIIRSFVNNMMNTSFVQSVPSKFGTIMDEASDPIGIELKDIAKKDGAYDVRIANNGALYMLDRVVPPISYNIVSTPALLRKARDLGVINWAIQDKDQMGLNFYAFLRASSANYALFLPNNAAFCGSGQYYVDPVSLGKNYSEGPRVLHFFYKDVNKDKNISVSAFKYNPSTGSISADSTTVTLGTVLDRMEDILNYHTVSLSQGEAFGNNKYYKTKHGGEIAISGTNIGATVKSGAQINGYINNNVPLDASTIEESTTDYSNGSAFVINHIIQAPETSVYGCLSTNPQFSKFMELCQPAELSKLLTKIGVSSTEQKQYTVFTDVFDNNITTNKKYDCLDYNVSFFNTYNYTLYAPDNDAMDFAFSQGLPTWDEVKQVMDDAEHADEQGLINAKAKALKMAETIRNFIRYHFQDFALYADNTIAYGDAQTLEDGSRRYLTSCNIDGAYQRIDVKGGSGALQVKDKTGNLVTINENSGKLVNFMARDYTFYEQKISTSSFTAIHEISKPLCWETTGRYDQSFSSNTAAAKQARLNHLNSLYDAQKRGVKFYK